MGMTNDPRPKAPAYFILQSQGRSIAAVSRVIDVPYLALRGAVYGHHRPSSDVRKRLTMLLGIPAEQLFHAEQLTEYRSRHRKAGAGGVSPDVPAAVDRAVAKAPSLSQLSPGTAGTAGKGSQRRSAGPAGVVRTALRCPCRSRRRVAAGAPGGRARRRPPGERAARRGRGGGDSVSPAGRGPAAIHPGRQRPHSGSARIPAVGPPERFRNRGKGRGGVTVSTLFALLSNRQPSGRPAPTKGLVVPDSTHADATMPEAPDFLAEDHDDPFWDEDREEADRASGWARLARIFHDHDHVARRRGSCPAWA
jgi:hypothetical protein